MTQTVTARKSQAATDGTAPAASSANKRNLAVAGLAASVLAIAVAGYFYLRYSAAHPSTNDAYVRAHVVQITPLVSGRVVEVGVSDYAEVQAGDTLLRIDPAPFRATLDGARARLQSARQQADANKAAVEAVRANLVQRQAELLDAERQAKRILALVKKGDEPKAAGNDAVARRDSDRAAVKAAQAALREAEERLGQTGDQNASVRAARAEVTHAELDLSHATLIAPSAGVLGRVTLRQGSMARAGVPLFPLIETERWWVDANFKETDLARIKPGQPATVSVDMYDALELKGTVVSLSPASGAAFSLLPPENATGNWIKVTQRFPVRVMLDVPKNTPALRIGASANVTIDTTHDSVN